MLRIRDYFFQTLYYWKYRQVSFSLIFGTYILIISFAFLFGWKYEGNYIYYLLSVSSSLTLGLWFVGDASWKDYIKCVYYYLTLSLNFIILPLFLSTITEQNAFSLWFISVSLIVCIFLFNYKTFLPVVLFFQLVGFLLIKLSGLPIYMELTNFLIQEITVIFIWLYVSSEKEKIVQSKIETFNELVMTLSHELSSYIASIDLSVDSFINESELNKNIIKNIKSSLRHMNHFIEFQSNNFRQYIPLSNNEPIDVLSSIKDILADYPFKDNENELVGIQGVDFKIVIDPVIFKIVIINLLKNALIFINKKGRGNIIFTTYKDKTKNIISVRDTGYGIKKEYMPYVYDKFFSRRKHGTGMGLYFCKQALQKCGANIACNSVFGEYTEFLIEFKRKEND